MASHQERVVQEKAELDDKICKLTIFSASKIYLSLPNAEQLRLARQLTTMNDYSSILGERISNF